jgi:hypothetical protein
MVNPSGRYGVPRSHVVGLDLVLGEDAPLEAGSSMSIATV